MIDTLCHARTEQMFPNSCSRQRHLSSDCLIDTYLPIDKHDSLLVDDRSFQK
jgi:hypothetical protein